MESKMKNCNLCDGEIETDNGDIFGRIGITDVAFCVDCYSGIRDMVFFFENINKESK